MINDIIEAALLLIKKEEKLNFEQSMNKLLTYLAINLFIDTDIEVELKESTLRQLDDIINIDDVKATKCEFLLSIYDKYIAKGKRKSCDLIDVLKLSKATMHLFPRAVFVDNLDTSKMTHFPKNILVYTTTTDILKYRIDIINRKLFKIPMFELYIGKHTNDDFNLQVTSKNWEFANKWIPVNVKHFEKHINF